MYMLHGRGGTSEDGGDENDKFQKKSLLSKKIFWAVVASGLR